jgi:hypothetical protein
MEQMQNARMKTIELGTYFAATLVSTLALASTRAEKVSPEEARAIARDAYIFCCPLAMQYRTMYVQAIDSTSKEYVGGFGKYRHYGMDDLHVMQEIQHGYKLQPLSAFLGQPAPSPAAEVDWPVWIDKVDRTAEMFRYVNYLLPFTRPHPLDQPMLDRIARIGIAPGKPWDLTKMNPELRQAIEDGVADGLKLISETIPEIRDAAKLYLGREQMKTDYLSRTMGVVIGQWGNNTHQAIYQGWPLDAEGLPPDTSGNNYTITFPPGQLPAYQFFWSIAMYGLPDRLLVPNSIQRCSIGSDSPDLKLAADGSLTIYIQKDSPGADKESNWLPPPDSPFSAILRVSGPGEAEQAGQWKAPALVRMK